jgi:hypothetical protein
MEKQINLLADAWTSFQVLFIKRMTNDSNVQTPGIIKDNVKAVSAMFHVHMTFYNKLSF